LINPLSILVLFNRLLIEAKLIQMHESFYNVLHITHPRATGFGEERARADRKKEMPRGDALFESLQSFATSDVYPAVTDVRFKRNVFKWGITIGKAHR